MATDDEEAVTTAEITISSQSINPGTCFTRTGSQVRVLHRPLGRLGKGHIRAQFLSEAVLLGLLGGVVATVIYAHTKHWATVIPTQAWAGGIAASLTIGAIAGLIPAVRAARLSPTEALWAI